MISIIISFGCGFVAGAISLAAFCLYYDKKHPKQ